MRGDFHKWREVMARVDREAAGEIGGSWRKIRSHDAVLITSSNYE